MFFASIKNCPKCGREWEEVDCYDVELTDTEVIRNMVGYCDCGVEMQWDDIYEYKKTIEKDIIMVGINPTSFLLCGWRPGKNLGSYAR